MRFVACHRTARDDAARDSWVAAKCVSLVFLAFLSSIGCEASSPAKARGASHSDGGATGSGETDGAAPGTSAVGLGGALGTGGAAGSGGVTGLGGSTSAGGSRGSAGGGAVASGETCVGGEAAATVSSGGFAGADRVLGSGGASAAGGTPGPADAGGSSSPSTFDAASDGLRDGKPDATSGRNPPENLMLVWSDEFNGNANAGIDQTKWSYVTRSSGLLVSGLQEYTNRRENVFLDGKGHLVIRALAEPSKGRSYTSGRIESDGKFWVGPGHRIEVNARLPAGKGSLAVITMLGTVGPWPRTGQLTLVQQWGQYKSWVHAFALADSTNNGSTGMIRHDFPDAATASADFHRYILDWYSDHLVFQVDEDEIINQPFGSTAPFASIPEYLVLYVAMGGYLGGKVDPDAFPMDMIVDYVRVYAF